MAEHVLRQTQLLERLAADRELELVAIPVRAGSLRLGSRMTAWASPAAARPLAQWPARFRCSPAPTGQPRTRQEGGPASRARAGAPAASGSRSGRRAAATDRPRSSAPPPFF